MNRSVRLLGGKNKNIDDVLTARIDQSRDVLASENIKTAADQLKTFIRKVFHRRDKSKLAVKPGLHGVIVRRSNVGEMPWLQGANVGVNDLSRVFTNYEAISQVVLSDLADCIDVSLVIWIELLDHRFGERSMRPI